MLAISTLDAPLSTGLHLPLAAAQPGIWMGDQIAASGNTYVVAQYVGLNGPLDVACFSAAVRLGLAEADMVHARFVETEAGPAQIIPTRRDAAALPEPDMVDVSGEADPAQAARRLMEADFDQACGAPAYRQMLIRLGAEHWFWYQRYHHLMVDGFSFTAVARRIAEIYTALRQGKVVDAAPFVSFAEVVNEYQAYAGSEAEARDRKFWAEHTRDLPTPISLAPISLAPASAPGSSGLPLRHRIAFDAAVPAALAGKGPAISDMAMAAIAIYLHRMTGASPVWVGLPFMRRLGSVALNAVGPVVNVLPVRVVVDPTLSLVQVAEGLAAELKAVRRHQRYEAEQLRRDLGLVGSGRGLYGPVLNFKMFDYRLDFAGIEGVTHQMASGPVEDVEIDLYLVDGRLTIDLVADANRYGAEDLARHGDRLGQLVRALAEAPDRPIGQIPLLGEAERALLAGWSQGPVLAMPAGARTVLDVFQRQVAERGDLTALVCGDKRLSFAALSGRACRLARLLRQRGIGPGDVVAVALPRSAESVAALLAVLSAGAAYLPLDLDYPRERLELMCDDARPALVITDTADRFDARWATLCADENWGAGLADSPLLDVELGADHAAYVIYTSGSTGRPKGVVCTHGGLLNLLASHQASVFGQAAATAGRHLRAALTASFCFDASWDPLIWMLLGHELHVFDEDTRRDAEALVEALRSSRIDVIEVTPLFLSQLLDCGLMEAGRPQPLLVIMGGEAVSPALWEALRRCPGLPAQNFYGPTECTVDSLTAGVDGTGQPVIGRPVANTEIHILNAALEPVPVGAVGELYLGGQGLARGYLGQPGLTATRFVANPARSGERMYRTGDLVRWRADGRLDFVGRVDHQVKVRGYRVELGEVESALASLPEISSAAVMVEAVGQSSRLVAYCAVAPGQAPDTALRDRLLEQAAAALPEHMVPSALLVLERLPMTVNGKVDRNALAALKPQAAPAGRAPETEAERLVCGTVAWVLNLPAIGADDDFFLLGGDSISAMALGTALRRAGYSLRPRDIFAQRTPARMARVLAPLAVAAPAVAKPDSGYDLDALQAKHGPVAAVLPALPLQEGLLFHAQLDDQASRYNAMSRFELHGTLNPARLRDALDAVLRRHPQLGVVFDTELGGAPLQIIPLAERRCPWSEHTLDPAGLERLERAELARDFLSGGGMLLHAALVRLATDRHVLLVTCHHLIGDGWSSTILLRDLLTAYGGGALPPITPDYPSVVRQLVGRDPAPARGAWREALQGAAPTLLFEEAALGAVRELPLALRPGLAETMEELRRRRGLTLNTLMQGVWAAFLGAMSGRDDVVFGSPVSGRSGAVDGIDAHIGLFTNTLPVRLRLRPDAPLLDQLQAVQERQIQLLEHDGLGLGEIQRLAGAATLFDTLLVVENYPEDGGLFTRDYAGLRCVGARNRGFTHYPLTLMVLPGRDLRMQLEYREGVAAPEHLARRLELLLEQLVERPDLPLSALTVQTEEERALLAAVNDTAMDIPPATLCQLLAEQARRTPDALALADAGHALTYREVRRQVVCLARALKAAGVAPQDRVAVALPRSVHLSLALMAVLEVGAAYLPLDTGYPDDRLTIMVEDAQPRLIITTGELRSRFEGMATPLVFDQLAEEGEEAMDTACPATPDHAAYVIYTSGSTGRPKGVVVSHRAIVNRLLWMQHEYGLGADDVVLQKTPSSFDVSVWEFFWPLITGARLVMAPPEAHRDPEELLRLIRDHRVTTMHFVPSMLAAFLAAVGAIAGSERVGESLRRVFCSGEALSKELAEAWQSLFPAPLHNLYGPTEAAVDVTYQPAFGPELAAVSGAGVPIGRPVWNTGLRVLDASLRPVPLGVAGDLYLTGVQLAEGYLRRPSLTASRFVADPQGNGERMYRTGDIARWLPDGAVEYLGRSDDQVKIRGQRIELGEIESALLDQPGVARAVVHARALGGDALAGADGRQLVGYVVPAAGDSLDGEVLRAELARRLPAHMVPVAILCLKDFPLSANGKLDRKALPDPGRMARAPGRKPMPGIETALAEIVARVLGLDAVSAEDDFFALGGHSLLAMRLAAELRRAFDKPISVGQVMIAPTVEALAQALFEEQAGDDRKAGFGDVLRLRSGAGNPLVCIHPASGFAWQFSLLPRYLRGQWPVIGLQSPRPYGPIAACRTMDEVCDMHLATLRQVQPHGPYTLIGYSLGGTVAQGLAARLVEQGEEVAFLGLLDTYPPETQDWSKPIDENGEQEIEQERALFMAASEDTLDPSLAQEKVEMFGHITANYDDSVRLLSSARTARYPGEATLFVARQTLPEGMDVHATWKPYVGGLKVVELDCAHTDIVSPRSLQVLGPILDRLLAELREGR